MRHLFVTARHLVSESYLCRLIMLCFIIVLIKSLRGLSSENFNEYTSIQYTFVI